MPHICIQWQPASGDSRVDLETDGSFVFSNLLRPFSSRKRVHSDQSKYLYYFYSLFPCYPFQLHFSITFYHAFQSTAMPGICHPFTHTTTCSPSHTSSQPDTKRVLWFQAQILEPVCLYSKPASITCWLCGFSVPQFPHYRSNDGTTSKGSSED